MIIFLYGQNDFLAHKKIAELKDSFRKKVDPEGNSISDLEGKTVTIAEINKNISSMSLLASKRMLVLENTFSNKDKNFLPDFLEYLENKVKANNENVIIIYEPAIKTKQKGMVSEMVKIDNEGKEKALLKKEKELFSFLSSQPFKQKEFKKLNSIEIINWIKKEFDDRGAEITAKGAQLLVALVGSDLWQIDNEINKLISYKKGLLPKITEDNEKVQVDVDEVNALVKGNFDENIFALTDAISMRNRAQAQILLENLYDAGFVDVQLLSMINRQIKILLQIRSALDNGMTQKQIATELKLHPFVVQKSVNQVRNFSVEVLKRILNRLVDIDYRMKTGQGSVRTLLNLLFSKI